MFKAIREDGSPLIVGILNVTPDSFSDGGRFDTLESACAHAVSMVADGADIVDVGGESTRPGSSGVDEDVQIEHVIPVLKALASRLPPQVLISIDTRSPRVAARAIDTGARLINDISAGGTPGMLELAAESGAGLVLMHMQGTPETMQLAPTYEDVVSEVEAYLVGRADLAIRAGVDPQRIAIDPGIGFGKTRGHNLKLLERLDRLVATGIPVMLGTSRKRFMGAICGETEHGELVGATCATTAMGVVAGVRLFRVHDVKQNRQAADVAWACRRAADSP
ncbi:MAG: dihydropteroate synthase [Gammaproteobacteria bacterium]|nr:dihydropteroate synthase [Gammaproteobacteria bacterium]